MINVDDSRTEMAGLYADRALYASLHSADPGMTGDNEIALARQPITWNTGLPGELTSDSITFSLTVAQFVTHVGIWKDSSAGTFWDSLQIDADLPVGNYTFSLSYVQQ
jgi:hypothetical protein